MSMQTKLSFRLLAGSAGGLFIAALAAAWFDQSNVESAVSVTVKLPPPHAAPKPGFLFR